MSAVLTLSPTAQKDYGKNIHNTAEYALDPKKTILDYIAPFLSEIPKMSPALVLVATYRQPEKTAGGLYKPDKYRDEDKFQGVTGLVLKKGGMAFVSDARTKFGDLSADMGDWVVYESGGNTVEFKGLHCRFVQDIDVKCVVSNPELFW